MAITDPKNQSEMVHETFLEAYNLGDLERIDDVCADDFVAYHTAHEEPIRSVEGYKQNVAAIRESFPDFEMERLESLYDGEMSSALYRWTGTHDEEFMGIPATGERITVDSLTMARLDDDGKLSELWVFGDSGSMMRQLGVTPGE